MNAWEELVRKLAIDDPWSWSQEGLDDCCVFCGSDDYTYENPGMVYRHEVDCAWLEARESLGLTQPKHAEHVRKEVLKAGADE